MNALSVVPRPAFDPTSALAGAEARMWRACDLPGPAGHPGDDPLDRAVAHHLAAGGSRVRMRLALAAGAELGLDESDAAVLAGSCELLHNASLVHDDVQDGDRERRGRPAVWGVFGADTAILVGDLLIGAAFGLAAEVSPTCRPARLTRHLRRAVTTTARGQDADLRARERRISRIDDYEAIARAKSGPLLALALELPLLAAGRERHQDTAHRAACAFGVAYQLVDDLADCGRDRSLNAVAVLQASGELSREAARRDAAQRARAHLGKARELAARLPCGGVLDGPVLRLEAQLGQHASRP